MENINNEVMDNIEETVDTVEEVATTSSLNGIQIGLIAVGVAGAGFVLYKLGKKAIEAYKAKKELGDKRHEGVEIIGEVDDDEE